MARLVNIMQKRNIGGFRLSRGIEEQFYIKEHPINNSNLWKKLTFYVALPAVGVCILNSLYQSFRHRKDKKPEYVPFSYLNRRTSRFPWGDGTKSLFHNPKVNVEPSK